MNPAWFDPSSVKATLLPPHALSHRLVVDVEITEGMQERSHDKPSSRKSVDGHHVIERDDMAQERSAAGRKMQT